MVNPKKIILMTKLELYNKKYGEKDRKANEFFRHDYIYWSNFWARLCALIGCFIVLAFYGLNLLFVDEADFFALDFVDQGYTIAKYIIITLFVVTAYNSAVETKRYTKAQKRIKSQETLMKKIDRVKDR